MLKTSLTVSMALLMLVSVSVAAENIEKSDYIMIDKLNDYFKRFQSLVSGDEVKNFLKQVQLLSLDTQTFLRPAKIVSSSELNEFIDSGLTSIHKKFQLDQNSLDQFLKEKQTNHESEFMHDTNAVDSEQIKSEDWMRAINQDIKIQKRVELDKESDQENIKELNQWLSDGNLKPKNKMHRDYLDHPKYFDKEDANFD